MALSTLTAVVVNDSPAQLKILSGLLQKAGIDSRPFTGAEDALAVMDPAHPPDLIVTDIYMPGIDGWRFCRLLRSPEYAAFNTVPVLVVSATYAGDEPERIAADLGADAFLPMPVDGTHFIKQAQALLRRQQERTRVSVLIADDDTLLSGALKAAFESHGYQAHIHATVREASGSLHTTTYAVAVIGYHLPDATGDVLLDALGARQPGCVCLMITSDPAPELSLDWMKRGAAACVRKPFDPEYLIEVCMRARRERMLLRTQELLEVRSRELRESEQNFSAMISACPESAFLIDTQGVVLCCNQVLADRLQRRPEDIVGRCIYDCLDPDIAGYRRRYVDQIVRTGKPAHFTDRRNNRIISHYLYPVRDRHDRVIRIAVFGNDITDYKNNEENLSRQNALLSSLRRAQELFISGHDSRRVYQDMLAILLQATDSEYGFLDEVMHDPDGTPYKLNLALTNIAWDDESRHIYDQLVERKLEFRDLERLGGAPVIDGRSIIANQVARHPRHRGLPKGHPPLNSYMGIPLFFGSELIGVAGLANRPGGYCDAIAETVTPLTQACAAMIWAGRGLRRDQENLAALQASEQKYRQIAETANEGIWAIDAEHRTTYVNQRMADMLGYPPDDMLGKRLESFIAAEDLEDFSSQMADRKRGRNAVYEQRLLHKDGSRVWTIISATAELNEHGDFTGSFAMLTDITDRKRAEAALRESEATVRKKLQAILDPADDIGALQLSDIIDAQALRTMMEDFFRLTGIGCAVTDLSGRTLVAVGWQDVCTRFHRTHPETLKGCLKSDIELAGGVAAGTYKTYKCSNNLWDMVTPIEVGGKHAGNIFLGQFFFENELPDYDLFRRQARRYGFDEADYLAAVDRVPRWSRETVEAAMKFYARLADMISSLSYSTVKLSRAVAQQETALRTLAEREETYRALVEGLPDIVVRLDQNNRHLFVSDNISGITGIPAAQVIGKSNRELGFPETRCRLWEEATRKVFDTGTPFESEFVFEGHQGTRTFNWRLIPEFDEHNNTTSVLAVLRDITEHKHAEKERERLTLAIEQASEVIVITDTEPVIQYVNPAFENVTGYTRAEALGRNPRILKSNQQDDAFYRVMWETLTSGETWRGRFVNKKKDGSLYTEEAVISPVCDVSGQVINYVAVKRDISEKLLLEQQLHQAQKMESVGRLAGGVAHDFNNMLGVICGNAELALEKCDPSQPIHADLMEIHAAARRSADLTRQLLAFARKQTISPQVLDLNETVESMLKMLRRLIGEDIELAWLPGQNLWPVKVDPSQIDQILANLAVNARDAIAGTGTVTIETGTMSFDTTYCAHHPDVVPGEYVLLALSDSGCGMDAHTRANLFEPFYTTKGPGKGTGLGLATVYGIVKQNNGFIHVVSETGKGTTFRIYVPGYAAAALEPVHSEAALPPAAGGTESVLLVEDEPSILHMTAAMLEHLGYTVLTAQAPEKALHLAEAHKGEIHLVITDVVMPGMNGKELVQLLQTHYPGLKRLFMSGYTSDIIAHHGVLDAQVHFIQKPFSMHDLAVKVREALDSA